MSNFEKIKSLKIYRHQLSLLLIYLTKNKKYLKSCLVLKPFNYLKVLNKKYNHSKDFYAYMPSKVAIWTRKNYRKAISIKNTPFNYEIKVGGQNPGIIFNEDPKDISSVHFYIFKNQVRIINAGDLSSGNVVSHLIIYIKILTRIITLNIKHESNLFETYCNQMKSQTDNIKAIKHGNYSWTKIFGDV